MTISMQNLENLTLAEMEEFVEGSRKLTLSVEGEGATYGFIEGLLRAQQYRRLSKKGQRGIVRRFLTKVSGLSPGAQQFVEEANPAIEIPLAMALDVES